MYYYRFIIIKCIAFKYVFKLNCTFFCSRVVTMSRECGTNGQWSSVDFSSCTFSSADQPPFILIWLLLSTIFSVTENRALAAEVSYTIFQTWKIDGSIHKCTINHKQTGLLRKVQVPSLIFMHKYVYM